jgi:ribosomal subunit interface protein
MRLPLQLTFRDLETSPAIEEYARKRAAKLDDFFDGIMRCHVVVEAPHRHQKQGRHYHVRIDLTVPSEEIVVGRNPDNVMHEDVYACIDSAFDDAQRALSDYARRRRFDVKQHEPTRHGRVVKLFSYEGYGFLQAPGGDDVYFHQNAVLHHGQAGEGEGGRGARGRAGARARRAGARGARERRTDGGARRRGDRAAAGGEPARLLDGCAAGGAGSRRGRAGA